MPRPLKPLKVDTVWKRDRSVSADIYFDRDAQDFFATVGQLVVRAKTAAECKAVAFDALKDFAPFVWEPLIQIASERDAEHSYSSARDAEHVQLHFYFRRFERARRFREEGYIERPHAVDRGGRDDDAVNDNHHIDRDALYFPYTDEMWEAILHLRAVVLGVKQKIVTITDPLNGGGALNLSRIGHRKGFIRGVDVDGIVQVIPAGKRE